jgi:serine/threonine protein phosphatase 1
MTQLFKRVARNTRGRDFAVGDIHGHFTRLLRKLDEIGFNFDTDRLFSVGDLVDRGPESEWVGQFLQQPWLHAVRGNHDDFAIRWPNGTVPTDYYIQNGGAWNVANPIEESRRISDLLNELPLAIELETPSGTVGIVHADCPTADWDSFVDALEHPENYKKKHLDRVYDMAMWSRERWENNDDRIVPGITRLIVGHTPMDSVLKLGNVFYIDTKGWKNGFFTIANLTDFELT